MANQLLGTPEAVLAVDGKVLSTTISPISILSDDILSLIFEINSWTVTSSYGSGEQENPLITARAASQVCQNWRLFLLNSPTIWGRCVNLDVLKDGKSEWREEVLRRTQSSPLWIVGDVSESSSTEEGSPMDIRSYFTRLLQSWERIQKLDVVIHGEEISEDIQNAFLSPAPILNQFSVYLPDVSESILLHTLLPDSTQSLFENYAPLLVEIHADMVAFRTDSPWLTNLRNIHIPPHVDVPGILDLLSRTPLLETLFISSSEATDGWDLVDKQLGTRIILPHLSVMYLTISLASCTTIINHVSPAGNCSLAIDSGDYDPIPRQVGDTLKQRLPTYISNYFTTHPSTHIYFQLDVNKFVFHDVSTSHESVFFQNRLYINSDSALYTFVSVIQAFVAAKELSPSLFDKVIKLDIDARDLPTSILPELYTMLLPFQSVEHLITSDDGIRCIMKLPMQDYHDDEQPVLFPNIHTLQMTYLIDDPEDENDNQSLLQFLESRRNAGLAVAKLDLLWCDSADLRDISDLERVHGLEVLWRSGDNTVSYVCGSGEPEKLRFNPPSYPQS